MPIIRSSHAPTPIYRFRRDLACIAVTLGPGYVHRHQSRGRSGQGAWLLVDRPVGPDHRPAWRSLRRWREDRLDGEFGADGLHDGLCRRPPRPSISPGFFSLIHQLRCHHAMIMTVVDAARHAARQAATRTVLVGSAATSRLQIDVAATGPDKLDTRLGNRMAFGRVCVQDRPRKLPTTAPAILCARPMPSHKSGKTIARIDHRA